MREAVTTSVDQAAGRGFTQSVVVADRRTGRTISSVRAGVRVPAMSLVKLFLASDVLVSRGGAGHVELATQARSHTMIATSDDSLVSYFYLRGGAGGSSSGPRPGTTSLAGRAVPVRGRPWWRHHVSVPANVCQRPGGP